MFVGPSSGLTTKLTYPAGEGSYASRKAYVPAGSDAAHGSARPPIPHLLPLISRHVLEWLGRARRRPLPPAVVLHGGHRPDLVEPVGLLGAVQDKAGRCPALGCPLPVPDGDASAADMLS